MTPKGLLRKQVIITINITITKIIIKQANGIIANIIIGLKNSNFKTIADFIKLVDNRVIINTNQATLPQDMSIIIKAIKDTMNINLNSIENPCLSKSKSYLNITGLSYYAKTTNILVIFFLIEEVLKNIHIFNDIVLMSKSYIIKTTSNYDSAVIWINIWDSQSGSKAKTIINYSFNVRQYIATIQDIYMSFSIP